MNVKSPRLSGFCPGVKHAEKIILSERNKNNNLNISVLGPLIHNQNYINFLENKGIKTQDNISEIPPNSTVAIRTHGIDKTIENKISQQHTILDLTCNKVKYLQLHIQTASNDSYFIVLCGKKNHPEVLGLISYAKHYIVVSDKTELQNILSNNTIKNALKKHNYQKILILSQTTSSYELFDFASEQIAKKLGDTYTIENYNSICPVTNKKEQEALEIQKTVDITFVVGDSISSNANKLYRILKTANNNTYFIDNLEELKKLNLPLEKYSNVQVASSASTPDFIEKDIIEWLKSI